MFRRNCFLFVFLVLCFSPYSNSFCQEPEGEIKIEDGNINGAPFRIEIPTNWNKGLVMYAHGYMVAGSKWNPDNQNRINQVFCSRGFAFAQSGYLRQGWSVKEGIEDTEALRRYFVQTYGKPDSTFITGHSMGGVITIATIERYPDIYNGAFPMCGPLSPSFLFFKEILFDLLVTFDYYYTELPPLITTEKVHPDSLKQAIEFNRDRSGFFAKHYGIKTPELPGIIAFLHIVYHELKDRAGGNPFDNQSTIYSDFDDDRKLNDEISRYMSDPKAVEFTKQYYTPTGSIHDPVLSIHTTYDPLVKAKYLNYYDILTTLVGTKSFFISAYVKADGHCNFTSEQMGVAFDALRRWAAKGIKPKPSEIFY